jgi:predicted Zn-ribbon and HTH transcriptional regulator
MKQEDTREAWLLRAIEHLRPIFSTKGHSISQTCMVSCGFASTGTRSHHIGQCLSTKSSGNGTNQIFISPTLVEPFDVLDTLVHELVHAVDDCAHKHGKEFKKIALSLGMVGPMRSARARCKKCGYEVPMFRKFLSYGPPLCPKDKIEMSPLGDWDEI